MHIFNEVYCGFCTFETLPNLMCASGDHEEYFTSDV